MLLNSLLYSKNLFVYSYFYTRKTYLKIKLHTCIEDNIPIEVGCHVYNDKHDIAYLVCIYHLDYEEINFSVY